VAIAGMKLPRSPEEAANMGSTATRRERKHDTASNAACAEMENPEEAYTAVVGISPVVCVQAYEMQPRWWYISEV
jgi:hypothetical protein